MLIITSASYINEELRAEFGRIPSCFLPLKNERLFKHQIDFLKKENHKKYITLPNSFKVNDFDRFYLESNDVQIVYLSDSLTLCESIFQALKIINDPGDEVLILHGDTLFNELPRGIDFAYVSAVEDEYNWGKASNNNAYAGLFHFQDQKLLSDSLEQSNNNFVGAINLYSKIRQITPIQVKNWMDFGHLNTYFRSKARYTTERIFNNLQIDKFTVKKISNNRNKILAEADWYQKIPPKLKKYIPVLINVFKEPVSGYELEYLYLNTLAELYVFGNNDIFIWKIIFNAIDQYFNDTLLNSENEIIKSHKKSFKIALINKTNLRLDPFFKQIKLRRNEKIKFNDVILPPIDIIIKNINSSINEIDSICYSHGDFCFSNILFDFRKLMLKVIDPRGVDFEGNVTILGDLRYDVAKLSHSIIGLYDFIIANRFKLSVNEIENKIDFEIITTNQTHKIQEEFVDLKFQGIDIKSKSNFAIIIHLFLSMLPLHNDNSTRQLALYANALRLYLIYEKL